MLLIPMPVDLGYPLRGLVSRELIDRLCSLRNRVVSLAEENGISWYILIFEVYFVFWSEILLDLAIVHDVLGLHQALEEYLPVLLGLTVKGINFILGLLLGNWERTSITFLCWSFVEHNLESLVEFKWRMLGDDGEVR